MACADDDSTDIGPCPYWDEDGCYCVCGAMCSCDQPRIVNVGDELHQVLAEALRKGREE